MADFAEESDHSAPLDDGEDEGVGKAEGLEEELADLDLKEAGGDSAGSTLAVQGPLIVVYCPVCSLPPEFCEFGPSFEECLPWITQNCPEVLGQKHTAKSTGEGDSGDEEEGEEKKKKKRGGSGPKKKAATVLNTKVVIARVQRQKRKYVTVVSGLETVPELKIKDAAKLFGRKFSSGASVSDTPTGGKEVVIQGDVLFELPALLTKEFKIAPATIFTQNDDGTLQACG